MILVREWNASLRRALNFILGSNLGHSRKFTDHSVLASAAFAWEQCSQIKTVLARITAIINER